MKNPSLHKLGFLVDHSHNMPVLSAILIFIDKQIFKVTAMNQGHYFSPLDWNNDPDPCQSN